MSQLNKKPILTLLIHYHHGLLPNILLLKPYNYISTFIFSSFLIPFRLYQPHGFGDVKLKIRKEKKKVKFMHSNKKT